MRWSLLSAIFLLSACNTDKIAQLEKQNRELTKQTQELKAQLGSAFTSTSLELQSKCAEQARAVYNADGWNVEKMARFTNHYNQKLNKCFIQIEQTDTKTSSSHIWMSKNVSDAFERKEYGDYMWRSDKVKKYWEVPPVICKVMLPSGEEKFCHSTDEVDTLIKQYMEQ
jgi:hypothetical protein